MIFFLGPSNSFRGRVRVNAGFGACAVSTHYFFQRRACRFFFTVFSFDVSFSFRLLLVIVSLSSQGRSAMIAQTRKKIDSYGQGGSNNVIPTCAQRALKKHSVVPRHAMVQTTSFPCVVKDSIQTMYLQFMSQ